MQERPDYTSNASQAHINEVVNRKISDFSGISTKKEQLKWVSCSVK